MKTALIADDQASGRKLIGAVLESCGYTVLEAEDGKTVLQQARAARPDFIIFSLSMPVPDGLDAVSALRRDPEFAATPILALAPSSVSADPALALSAGFSGCITIADLQNEVARLLRLASVSG